jgi:hypothetical protein
VRQSASTRREEEQRWGVSEGRGRKEEARRLRRRKQWAANTVGGEAATTVSWVWARRQSPLSEEVGTVRMRSAHGSDRAVDGWAPTVSLLSPNYLNRFKLGN